MQGIKAGFGRGSATKRRSEYNVVREQTGDQWHQPVGGQSPDEACRPGGNRGTLEKRGDEKGGGWGDVTGGKTRRSCRVLPGSIRKGESDLGGKPLASSDLV